ncbi:hypothetical protein [Cumulibacter manganitolerans]|uniref:hypothetical protein n=1 Tax=Cumulibacter manganitolerans TaxID=1884992 RepID=UPI00129618B6|nr:hypothetical protein [Cumulibacter manganitolerans]
MSTSADQPPIGVETPLATVYAMRTWYTTAMDQNRQLRTDLARRLRQAEEEVRSLEAQVVHSEAAITALQSVLDKIDDWIRKLTPTEGIFAQREDLDAAEEDQDDG